MTRTGTQLDSNSRGVSEALLRNDDVRVWRVPLDRSVAEVSELATLLSDDERVRAARFVHADVRRRFVVARASLRTILAGELDRDAAAIRFSYGEHGRPFIDDVQLSFNLSHSNELAIVGVTQGGIVGVDVEALRDDADIELLARESFCESERQGLLRLCTESRRAAFFATWTRKEAYLKALGTGFTISSRTFEVTVDPFEAPRLLTSAIGKGTPDRCKLATFWPSEPYVASLAVLPVLSL